MDRATDRWDTLTPVATAVAAVVTLALAAPATVATTPAPVPGAGILSLIAREGGGGLARAAAIFLVALVVTALATAVRTARPGWPGRLASVVVAGWLLACPPVRALASALSPAAVGLAAIAVAVAALDRVARGAGAGAARTLGAAAAVAATVDPRAWPLAAVAATLFFYRARRGARWGASAAAAAAIAAAVVLGIALVAGGPHWLSADRGALVDAIDLLGPLALAMAAAGVVTAAATRGDRWLVVAAAAASTAALTAPLVAAIPVVAIGIGLAAAALLARAPAVRHQLVTTGAMLALVASALAWG